MLALIIAAMVLIESPTSSTSKSWCIISYKVVSSTCQEGSCAQTTQQWLIGLKGLVERFVITAAWSYMWCTHCFSKAFDKATRVSSQWWGWNILRELRVWSAHIHTYLALIGQCVQVHDLGQPAAYRRLRLGWTSIAISRVSGQDRFPCCFCFSSLVDSF